LRWSKGLYPCDVKGVQARGQKIRKDSLGGSADGPLLRRYNQLTSGGGIGIAFGYFGEASANMHRLLGEVAATLAPKPKREHRVSNAATALGVAKGVLRREGGAAIWQGQVRGLITRCKFAVPGRKEAEGRRAHAQDSFRARRTHNEAQWRANEWSGRFEGSGGGPFAAPTAAAKPRGCRCHHRNPSAPRGVGRALPPRVPPSHMYSPKKGGGHQCAVRVRVLL
jgi:hypothetical protein